MAAAKYEWAVSADKKDWTVVETEDDDTFAVTADLVGMYVKVTVTAEDGETASDVTTAAVPEASGQIEITSAEATKADEITVALAHAVDADDVTITLARGTDTFEVTPKWADTNDSVVLKTAAKLSKGTYTVTLTSIEDEDNTDSADFEVVDQHAERIEILNQEALTSKDKKTAYAYYEVYDQYDEPIRSSTSITWAGSCKITANKSNGELKLERTDEKAWTYSEKIYITGVNTKTGTNMSAELTVGSEQNLDKIEMKGFVKKGTTDIIEAKDGLPKGFKDGEYYMLFNALDQNGNELAADALEDDGIGKDNVTFLSDNPLVIKELTKFKPGGLMIAGEEYCAVEVTPGIKNAEGGEVTITAIANKTGNQTKVTFMVGEDPVVASFILHEPTGTVADGDTGVEIPFDATDEDGKPITNFRTIAKQKTFNTVSFASSEGALTLTETDEGTAKLTWSDDAKYNTVSPTTGWALSDTTDGVDRPVSLTAVVVGGESSNQMISVQDKRRPDSIAAVNLKNVFVEGAAINIENTKTFKFYDQYGAVIGSAWGADNGFFAAAATEGKLKGTEFAGYSFGVRIKNAGSEKMIYRSGASVATSDKGDEFIVESGATAKFATATDILAAQTNEGFKFEVAKIKPTVELPKDNATNWEALSSSKYHPVTIVDITQVKNLKLGSLDTFYVGSLDVTGDKVVKTGTNLKDTPVTVVPNEDGGIYTAGGAYDKAVTMTGTYNGNEVEIPNEYFTIEANKLVSGNTIGTTTDRTFDAVIPYSTENEKGLQAADLYDKTTAKGVAKLADDEVTATVYQIYGENEPAFFWGWDTTNHEFKKVLVKDYADAAAAHTAANNQLTASLEDEKEYQSVLTQVKYINEQLGENTVTTATLEDYKWDTDALEVTAASYTAAETAVTNANTAYNNAVAAEKDAKQAIVAKDRALASTLAAEIPGTENAATKIANGANPFNYSTIYDEQKDEAIAYLKAKTAANKAALALTDAGAAIAAVKDAVDAGYPVTKDTDPETITEASVMEAAIEGVTDANKANVVTYLKKKVDSLAKSDAATRAKNVLTLENQGIADAKKVLDGDNDKIALGTATADEIEALNYSDLDTARVTAMKTYLLACVNTSEKAQAKAAANADLLNWKQKKVVSDAEAAGTQTATLVESAFGMAKAENDNAKDTDGDYVGISLPAVYDKAKTPITLSDQAPYAYEITGLADSYTLNPTNTKIENSTIGAALAKDKVMVVDQYGVKFSDALAYTVSNVAENKAGWAENNFKVVSNGTTTTRIEGAELGDTFDLTVSYETLKVTTSVTVGADTKAYIQEDNNVFRDDLVYGEGGLEDQRLAGLE